MHFPGSHEDRLEPDAFLSNVASGANFGTLTDCADRFQVLGREAILVALNSDLVGVYFERDIRVLPLGDGCAVIVVIRIL
jgi:hypothetical protein